MIRLRSACASTSTTSTRLIGQILDLLGPAAQLITAQEREWASATFAGARHRFDIRLALPGHDAPEPAVLASLAEHEFSLVREIVADCIVTDLVRSCDSQGQAWLSVGIEILTVAAD